MTATAYDRDEVRPLLVRLPPVVVACAAHLLAFLLASIVDAVSPWQEGGAVGFALTQAAFACALGVRLGLPAWWVPINLAFLPAAVLLSHVTLSPWAHLAVFLVLASIYRTTARSRVPLFLSSGEACEALAALLPDKAGTRVLDIGCGVGTVLIGLARARPDIVLHGSELALVPALIAKVRTRLLDRCTVRREDFWNTSLEHHDVVYAFLSPAVMAEVWRKVRREMKPGSLFVSNSFDVPGVQPERIVRLSGRHSSALLVWRV